MTPEELIAGCREQIALAGENAKTAVVMRGRWGKRNHRTLIGVRGEIVQELEHGILVMFPAAELLNAVWRRRETSRTQ